jgi:hypothetical protein
MSGTVQAVHEDIATRERYEVTTTINDHEPDKPTPNGWRPVGPWKPFAVLQISGSRDYLTFWRRKYARWQGGSII